MRRATWRTSSPATTRRTGTRGSRRFRRFTYEEPVDRDKANLDIFWLRHRSLEGPEDLQPPDVIATEIAENLEAALEQFSEIHEELAEQASVRSGE